MGRPKGSKNKSIKQNDYKIDDRVAYIQLTKGQETIVDIGLLEEILQNRWCAAYAPCKKDYYCVRADHSSGKHKLIKLHRYIWELKNGPIPEGLQIDHINQSSLDNRLENLRVVTPTENQRNRKRQSNNSSGFTGVHWYKPNSKWMAYIVFKGKKEHLGYFNCLMKAALTYDRLAREYNFHQNHLNFSDEMYRELLIKHPI